MRKRKVKYFLNGISVLMGVLLIGAPLSVTASMEESVSTGESETQADHSQEGQIQRPSGQQETGVFEDDPTNNSYGYYTIMGSSTVTVEDMAAHFNRQNLEYPSDALKEGGAGSIEEFCTILSEEAETEDVRAEVVFEQAMLETGWLQFPGVCKVEQFNFAGLGATGGDEEGVSFPDVRTGLRAQVQHLKAYASTQELVNACVDERFDLVVRESAPYVEWLGIQENPYGGGWAAGEGYGYKLRELLAELTGTEYISPTPVPTEPTETAEPAETTDPTTTESTESA